MYVCMALYIDQSKPEAIHRLNWHMGESLNRNPIIIKHNRNTPNSIYPSHLHTTLCLLLYCTRSIMAHQAHNIPWNVLASNFKYYFGGPETGKASNLYCRLKPTQGKELSYFVDAFAKNLEEHTRCERRKYSDKYEPPDANDIILDSAIVKKISPTVYRWRRKYNWVLANSLSSTYRGRLCQHNDGFQCGCPIPFEERKASSFLRQRRPNECFHFFEKNQEPFFNIELVKTLLLFGEN